MHGGWRVLLNDGKKDYLLGAHPLWQFFRGVYRMIRPPYVVGGLCLLGGYFWPMLLQREKTAPAEVVTFRRQEQRTRLANLIKRLRFPSGPL